VGDFGRLMGGNMYAFIDKNQLLSFVGSILSTKAMRFED
jgi:hypothetical protein